MKRYSLAFFLYTVLLCPHALGVIYKWVDENGITHYTDDPREVPAEHQTLDDLPPVHSMQVPDKALTRVQQSAQKDRQQRTRQVRSRRSSTSHASCEAYRRQLDTVQAKLRRGYREPRGNKLRQRRRELSALIKETCY